MKISIIFVSSELFYIFSIFVFGVEEVYGFRLYFYHI